MAKLPKPPFPMPIPPPESTEELIAQLVQFTEGIDETRATGDAPFVAGLFPSDRSVLSAAKAVRAAGHDNLQVWSPYPVHGLDPVLGLKRSLLGRPVFTICLLGFLFCFSGIAYLTLFNWTVIYGGKPFFTWQLWVVPTLEAGLLFGAVFNLKLCFAACKLLPDPFTRLPDPRLTDDQFCIAISTAQSSTAKSSAADLEALLKANGATEVFPVAANIASGNPVFRPLVEPVPAALAVAKEPAHA